MSFHNCKHCGKMIGPWLTMRPNLMFEYSHVEGNRVLCGPYGHIAEPEGAPDFSPEMQILREVVAVGVTSAPLSFPRDFSMVVEKATNLLKKMVEEARLAGTHS